MNVGERLYEVKKGLTIGECTAKAETYISKNGVCLFLFDVKGSKQSPNREELQEQLFCLTNELNIEFDRYFPENNLATISRQEKGFYSLLGDGSWVGINNAEVIPMIVNYIQKSYPNISFYYDVAVDGYDEATKLVK